MSSWPATKAKRVLAALLRIGWNIKRQSGSHRTLFRQGGPDFVFAFHDGDELGPRMLSRIARRTGLTPEDLQRSATETILQSRFDAGRTASVPLAWFPRLLNATVRQRQDWELIGGGVGIHWAALDEDVSVGQFTAAGEIHANSDPDASVSRIASARKAHREFIVRQQALLPTQLNAAPPSNGSAHASQSHTRRTTACMRHPTCWILLHSCVAGCFCWRVNCPSWIDSLLSDLL